MFPSNVIISSFLFCVCYVTKYQIVSSWSELGQKRESEFSHAIEKNIYIHILGYIHIWDSFNAYLKLNDNYLLF